MIRPDVALARAEIERGRRFVAARILLPCLERGGSEAREARDLLADLRQAPHGAVLAERLRFGPPETWRGWHPDHGAVAVKLGARLAARDLARRMEFRHPLVAPLLAFGADWTFSGWVDGVTLAVRAEAGAAEDVGSALAALHAAGLFHGDVSPANVVVTEAGRAVLIDWGERNAGTPGWRPLGPCADPRGRDRSGLERLRHWLGERRDREERPRQ